MDENWLKKQRKAIKKVKFIIGYPSTLHALSKYCISKGDTYRDFKIKGIITTAEPLLNEHKKDIEKLFGCEVVSRYSTEEFGVLANQCHAGNHHLNEASFHFEFLKIDKDSPAKEGEVSRIIITDLYSHALPLIRYDIGDLGVFQNGCECGYKGQVLTSIMGRKVETIYNPNGVPISPFALNGAMRDINGVLQYQFIQEGINKYTLKVVQMEDFTTTEEKLIHRRIQDILGDKIHFKIQYVKELPALPSGKRPYIINKLNKR